MKEKLALIINTLCDKHMIKLTGKMDFVILSQNVKYFMHAGLVTCVNIQEGEIIDDACKTPKALS